MTDRVAELTAWIAEQTGCNMRWKANRVTLCRWLQRYGEDRIRECVPGLCEALDGNGRRHRNGQPGADPRWLANWEYQAFVPFTVPVDQDRECWIDIGDFHDHAAC